MNGALGQVVTNPLSYNQALKALLRAGEGHYMSIAYSPDRSTDLLNLHIEDGKVVATCFESLTDWANIMSDRIYSGRSSNYGIDPEYVIVKGKPMPVLYIPAKRAKLGGYSTLTRARKYILRAKLLNKGFPDNFWLNYYLQYMTDSMPKHLKQRLLEEEALNDKV